MTPSEEFFSGFAAHLAAQQYPPRMPRDLVLYQSLVFAKVNQSTEVRYVNRVVPAGRNLEEPPEFSPIVARLKRFLLDTGLLSFALSEADAQAIYFQPPRQSYAAPEVVVAVATRYVPSGRFDGKNCFYRATAEVYGFSDQVSFVSELIKDHFAET